MLYAMECYLNFSNLNLVYHKQLVLSSVPVAMNLDNLFYLRDFTMSSFIILYADNIILLTQSVSQLSLILTWSERELVRHDH